MSSSKRTASPKPTATAAGKKDGDKDKDKAAVDAKDVAKEEKKEAKSSPVKKIIGFVVVAIVGFLFYKLTTDKQKVKESLVAAVDYVESCGDNAVYVYMAFTLIGVVFTVPTTPMELAGGFLFSPKYGMWTTLALTAVAKLIANTISVVLAKNFFRKWVFDNVISKFELLQMVSSAVKDEPWKMAFLVRGSMLPLAVKNYGLGVMDIGYTPIACFSLFFTTFYAFQNIYMGSMLSDLKDVFAPKKAAPEAAGDWLSTAKSLAPMAFNVLLVVFLIKAIKAQIKKTKDEMEKDLKEKHGKDSKKES